MKNGRRILALLCAFALLLPAYVPAVDGPSLKASSTEVTAGSYFNLTVTSANFAGVAGVSFELFYDSAAFTIVSATGGPDGYHDINTDEPGRITVGLLDVDGFDATGTLLSMRFQAKSTAEAGDYPIAIAIGEAYDTALTPLSIGRTPGTVTVKPNVTQGNTVGINCSRSSYRLKQGEETTLTFSSYSLNGLAAGNFELLYDHELLEYVGLSLGNGMTGGGLYISSVNTDTPGRIFLSYASEASCTNGTLFSVRLRAKADVAQTTTLTLSTNELISADHRSLTASDQTISLTLEKTPVEEVLPKMLIGGPDVLATNESAAVTVTVEGTSGLAAGDFTISYDQEKLEIVTEPTPAPGVGDVPATVMVNPNCREGTIRFSFICSDGVKTDTSLLTFQLRPKANAVISTSLTCTGKGMVNAQYQKVELEFPTLTISTQIPTFEVVFQTDTEELSRQQVDYLSSAAAPTQTPQKEPDQEHHYEFTGWDREFAVIGENLTVNAVFDAIAHTAGTAVHENIAAASCSTEGRFDEVVYCSVCNRELSREQKKLEKTDHTEAIIPAQAPTCTATGLTEGKRCAVCGEVLMKQETVDATGHTWDGGSIVQEPTETETGLRCYSCMVCGATKDESMPEKKVEATGECGKSVSWTMSNYGALELRGVGEITGESSPWKETAEITVVKLGYGITKLGSGFFDGCTALEKLTIPDTITQIEADALIACTGLRTIHYGGVEEQWKALGLSIPEGCSVTFRQEPILAHITADQRVTISGVTRLAEHTGEATIVCAFYDGSRRLIGVRLESGTGIVSIQAELPAGVVSCKGFFVDEVNAPLCAAVSAQET